jgi:hypothetical protein
MYMLHLEKEVSRLPRIVGAKPFLSRTLTTYLFLELKRDYHYSERDIKQLYLNIFTLCSEAIKLCSRPGFALKIPKQQSTYKSKSKLNSTTTPLTLRQPKL